MNVDITRPCKAKNPATCRYHTEVSKYAQELASIKQQIMETKDEEKFNLYYQVRSQQGDLERLIDLVEHKDLATAVTNGNAEYSTEVKKLLTAVIGQARRTNNADHVSWNDFIRLATSYTSPQSYGGTIETIYRIKNGYEKVKASDAREM